MDLSSALAGAVGAEHHHAHLRDNVSEPLKIGFSFVCPSFASSNLSWSWLLGGGRQPQIHGLASPAARTTRRRRPLTVEHLLLQLLEQLRTRLRLRGLGGVRGEASVLQSASPRAASRTEPWRRRYSSRAPETPRSSRCTSAALFLCLRHVVTGAVHELLLVRDDHRRARRVLDPARGQLFAASSRWFVGSSATQAGFARPGGRQQTRQRGAHLPPSAQVVALRVPLRAREPDRQARC